MLGRRTMIEISQRMLGFFGKKVKQGIFEGVVVQSVKVGKTPSSISTLISLLSASLERKYSLDSHTHWAMSSAY